MEVAQSVLDIIGNTPLLKLQRISAKYGANIFGKCEFMNPNSSVKDRIALNMIKKALDEKKITLNTTLIEPTSGNTGIGLASVCASLGIKLILTMPSSMSIERRKLMQALGAQLELTAPEKGMNGAVKRAFELSDEIEDSFILQQFENPDNPEAHRQTTAKEIIEALDGEIDVFVAGIGTGGTFTGVGEVLRERNPDVKLFVLEPSLSPVLSGGNAGPHKIQGIGAGFIPKNLNTNLYDGIMQVETQDAYRFVLEAAKSEGILVGISSGANLWAATQLAKKFPGKNIVTMLCDTAERYLSTELFEFEN
ncbi:cysteine synthase A [Helicobacter sp. 12S02232-10]|uniref:cysteine synthase A n=1 Tax=Helicobacter sp. 12S02232-10 TaxID=1476197 RepID=UPI000BA58B1B|nr:cysteine synthase A [Helicobacter sp. 12S02232-10]PAF49573.1 cysteine synthase A [Helicobacter sp. 12S02232-10]